MYRLLSFIYYKLTNEQAVVWMSPNSEETIALRHHVDLLNLINGKGEVEKR